MLSDFDRVIFSDELIEILHDKNLPLLERILARCKFLHNHFKQRGKYYLAEMYTMSILEIEERLEYDKLRNKT